MENIHDQYTFEEIAQQRDQLLDRAFAISTDKEHLTADTLLQLGELAYTLANHNFTYPAQAEHLMTTVAAATQDTSIADKAHKTIDNVFKDKTEQSRLEAHENIERTIELASQDIPLRKAAQLAIGQTFLAHNGITPEQALERMMESKAIENRRTVYAQEAEKDHYLPDYVSQSEAYELWQNALTTLENADDKTLSAIAADEIVEVAEIVAAQVSDTTIREELDRNAVEQAGEEQRDPLALDAFIVAQTAIEISDKLHEQDTDRVLTLQHAADRIIDSLPAEDRLLCAELLNQTLDGNISPHQAIDQIDKSRLSTAA